MSRSDSQFSSNLSNNYILDQLQDSHQLFFQTRQSWMSQKQYEQQEKYGKNLQKSLQISLKNIRTNKEFSEQDYFGELNSQSSLRTLLNQEKQAYERAKKQLASCIQKIKYLPSGFGYIHSNVQLGLRDLKKEISECEKRIQKIQSKISYIEAKGRVQVNKVIRNSKFNIRKIPSKAKKNQKSEKDGEPRQSSIKKKEEILTSSEKKDCKQLISVFDIKKKPQKISEVRRKFGLARR